MSELNDPTIQEILNWSTRQELNAKMMQITPDWRTVFMKDLDEILWRVIDFKKGPTSVNMIQWPKEASASPEFANIVITPKKVLPRPLPFGLLRRMARVIGFEELRYIFKLAQHDGRDDLRIDVTERLPGEKLDKGKQDKSIVGEIIATQFGNAVLACEAKEISREKAFHTVAKQMRLPSSSIRSLERLFKKFENLSRHKGFVGDVMKSTQRLPKHGLRALRAKSGRKKIPPK